jgi:hypothetical protein
MHVKCQYCGTDCWDAEARAGHEVLCDQNPANGKVKVVQTVATGVIAELTTTAPEPVVQPGAPVTLVFGGKSYPGKTPEEVIKIDRTYIEWAASLYRDPAIKQRCKELLMENKK